MILLILIFKNSVLNYEKNHKNTDYRKAAKEIKLVQ